jgi:hypothetical protein
VLTESAAPAGNHVRELKNRSDRERIRPPLLRGGGHSSREGGLCELDLNFLAPAMTRGEADHAKA